MLQLDLAGTRALVTGSAMGIGAGIAAVLAEAGAHVIGLDITPQAGSQVIEAIVAAGGSAEFIELDLREVSAVEGLGDQLARNHPSLDLVVNNAGVAHFAGVAQTQPKDWEHVMSVDLRAPYLVTRACLSLLEASERASVINIASVHSRMTVATMTAYAAAKGGVAAMTRSMAQELGALGIRVNTVSPGFVDTPLFRSWLESEPDPEASMARVLSIIPTGHIATPREIGQVIAFLASDLARSISGVNLMVDGALTTRLMH